ncbi:MAG: PD40 domain-containing protein [Bacteroidia bacterium]|nr:PD40 domain-containing protein [Bacteroidia bacterium]
MKNFLLSFVFICFISSLFAQGNMKTRKWRSTELDSLTKAQTLFEEENFVMALPIFEALHNSHPKELYLKYVYGICGLYRSDMHEKSLQMLSEVYEKNKKAADIEYDLARANHFNYKFDEAILLVEKYLKGKKLTEAQRKAGEQLINYCNNAKMLVAAPVDAKIENIGDIVNTVASEYVPVISSDENVMIFTYRGDQSKGGLQNGLNQPDPMGIYYEDVFITHKENGAWVSPSSIGDNINTKEHDAAIALSNDGQKLFIFNDNGSNGGDIYLSKLEGASWSDVTRLEGDVNTIAWEGSCALSADEKTLFFSSERVGGLGGKDIYVSQKMSDGSWGPAKNLGDKINTPLDDDAPFIHPDGKKLIYSSKGLNSMGGYDIFSTEYNKADSSWSTPKNIGYPINTPDDDIYFVLSADGKRGYYASGKTGGYGLQDIYLVEMPEGDAPVLAMVKGTITADKKPVKSEIVIEMTDQNTVYNTIASNEQSGGYLVNLPAGHNYKITYKYGIFPVQVKEVDTRNITAYLEKTIDINFEIVNDSVRKADSLLAFNKSVDTTATAVVVPQKIDIGNSTKEGLEFKVQIAAYNLPKNYNYNHLKGLGAVEKLLLDDGITRFTIGGSFKTLNEADAHKAKVRAAGQTDAFVTAIYNGKRVYLEDLEKLGLIPPQPK